MEPSVHEKLADELVVLASGSPARKQLIAQLGFPDAVVVVSEFAEDLEKGIMSPYEYALKTAQEKAMLVYQKMMSRKESPAIVIAADTIVVANNEILEKPRDQTDHFNMLKKLKSLKVHKVITAMAVVAPMEEPISPGYCTDSSWEETQVFFNQKISDDFLQSYVASGEGTTAAGGYRIQGKGALLVERIEGDYYNVVGLPMVACYNLMDSILQKAKMDSQYDSLLS